MNNVACSESDEVPHVEPVPKIFVLTLNWNGAGWLGPCLEAALAIDYPNFEVVVVDNGSSDRSASLVRDEFPSVHLVQLGQNLGYSRGFNAGMAHAAARGAEYFLIMNNDTVIDRQALKALVQAAQRHERVGFVTGKVYFHDRPNVLQSVGKKEHRILWNGEHIGSNEEDEGQYEQEVERPFLDDVYTLVNRTMYDQVGGYDPQFFLQAEEFDWQVRAKKAGWRLFYAPDAKLWHYGSMSMGGLGSPVSRYFLTRNLLVVIARHGGPWRWLGVWFLLGYQHLRSAAGGVARGSPDVESRLAGVLGWAAGSMWLFHRRPATGIPAAVRNLAERSVRSA